MSKKAKSKDIAGYGNTSTPPLPQGKNWLLLIAINAYTKTPLNNCVKDAKAVKKILLERYTFEKTEVRAFYDHEATRSNLIEKIEYFAEHELKEHDNVIIYYSGHGIDRKKSGFCWVPIEAESGDASLYIKRADIIELLNYMNDAKVRHIFMLIDSCFSGTMGIPTKSIELPEDRLEAEPSRRVLSSARKELASDGEEGGHSPFAQCLIDLLKENNEATLPVGTLSRWIMDRVPRMPNVAQVPSYEPLDVQGHAGGEMVLHLRESLRKKIPNKGEYRTTVIPDLLAHLPIHEDIGYPAMPYKGLRWFERADARIFFGRKQEINDLFQLLNNEHDQRKKLILLYGASGSGKSSFLFAGVLPRLPQHWQVAYKRRGQDGSALDILTWLSTVSTEQKAVLILDQLEEIFSNPGITGAEESAQLSKTVTEALRNYPNASVILSFREEYLGRVMDALNYPSDSYTTMVLNHLSRSGIVEALTGVTKEASQHYRGIDYEDSELPQDIAARFVSMDAKTFTPLIQYLLRRMWDQVASANATEPLRFTRSLYDQLHRETLRELLDTQLNEFTVDFSEDFHNGLLNDLLFLFVSSETTSKSYSISEIQEQYKHLPSEHISALCKALEDNYLLSSFIDIQGNLHYRLCHDALAPAVSERFNESEAPGPVLTRAIKEAMKNKSEMNRYIIRDIGRSRKGRRNLNEEESKILNHVWKKYVKTVARDELSNNGIKDVLNILREYVIQFKDGKIEEYDSLDMQLSSITHDIRTGVLYDEDEIIEINIFKKALEYHIDKININEITKLIPEILTAIHVGNLDEIIRCLGELQLLNYENISNINLIMHKINDTNEKIKNRVINTEALQIRLSGDFVELFSFLIDYYILNKNNNFNVLSVNKLIDFIKTIDKGKPYQNDLLNLLENIVEAYDIETLVIVLGQWSTIKFTPKNEDEHIYINRFHYFVKNLYSSYHFLLKANKNVSKNIFRDTILRLIYENSLTNVFNLLINFGQYKNQNNERLLEIKKLFNISMDKMMKDGKNYGSSRRTVNKLLSEIISIIAPDFGTDSRFNNYLEQNPSYQKDILENLKNEKLINSFGNFEKIIKAKAPILLQSSMLKDTQTRYVERLMTQNKYQINTNRIRSALLEIIINSVEKNEDNQSLILRFDSIKNRVRSGIETNNTQETIWALEDLCNLLLKTSFARDVIHQTGRYKNLYERIIKYKISYDKQSDETYEINDAILQMLKEIEKELHRQP